MDKRSDFERKSKWVEEFPVPVESKSISLILLRNTKLRIKGISGKEYFFDGSGSVREVDQIDAKGFLEMRRNSCNCSGMPGLPLFEEINVGG